MKLDRYVLLVGVAMWISLFGCSGDDSNGAPSEQMGVTGEGSYKGLLSGGTESGVLQVSVGEGTSPRSLNPQAEGDAPLVVSGTLTIGAGAPIELTGTYDPSIGAFSVSGGGYALSGAATSQGITGSYTGPNGGGAFAIQATSSGTVSLFCGTFAGDSSGTWNLIGVEGGAASGAWASAEGSSGAFAGAWKNGSITLTSQLVTATGSLSATGGTGTWTADSNSGTWLTAPCQ